MIAVWCVNCYATEFAARWTHVKVVDILLLRSSQQFVNWPFQNFQEIELLFLGSPPKFMSSYILKDLALWPKDLTSYPGREFICFNNSCVPKRLEKTSYHFMHRNIPFSCTSRRTFQNVPAAGIWMLSVMKHDLQSVLLHSGSSSNLKVDRRGLSSVHRYQIEGQTIAPLSFVICRITQPIQQIARGFAHWFRATLYS
jgi:hypothetical protein